MRFAAIVVGVGLLAACTSDPPAPAPTSIRTPKPVVSPPTSSPSQVDSLNSAQAERVYLRFISASYDAYREPKRVGAKFLPQFSIDQALSEARKSVLSLAYDDLVYSGTPPTSRVRVLREQRTASPHSVTLVDCPTVSASWKPVQRQNGRQVKIIKFASPPPYALAAVVVLLDNKWKVSRVTTDRTKTCKP